MLFLCEHALIVTVDGVYIAEVGFEQVTGLLAGEAGASVNLTINRNDRTFDFSLIRAQVEIPSVYYCLDGDNGYIKLTSFTRAYLKTRNNCTI